VRGRPLVGCAFRRSASCSAHDLIRKPATTFRDPAECRRPTFSEGFGKWPRTGRFVFRFCEQSSDANASRERMCMFTSPRARGEVERAKRVRARGRCRDSELSGKVPSSGSRITPLATFSPHAGRRESECAARTTLFSSPAKRGEGDHTKCGGGGAFLPLPLRERVASCERQRATSRVRGTATWELTPHPVLARGSDHPLPQGERGRKNMRRENGFVFPPRCRGAG